MQWLRSVVLAAVAVVAAVGCLAPQRVEMSAVNPREWREPESVLFENNDTLSLRRLSIALRYNHNFKQDTLSVQVNVSLPDARQFSECVTLRIDGNGRASSPFAMSESVAYREHSLLSQRGSYIFTISPLYAVRGIEAVGIEVETETDGKR